MTDDIALAATEQRPIDWIKPYWRNPRQIGEEAVAAVADSIRRYGYTQPIVTDPSGVIIIGHTRYAALRRLGAQTVQVLVRDDLDPARARQLRLIDNRSAELTTWDYDRLAEELSGLDEQLMQAFFPEVAPGEADPGFLGIGADTSDPTAPTGGPVDFVCPRCFHSWSMVVDPDDVVAGRVLRAPAAEEEQA